MKRVLPILLLGLFLLQGVVLIGATSPTTDETAFHMVNGYVYLKTHDYRMSPANPPLLRQWMALPWLALRPKLDLDKPSWKEADSVSFAREFFYKDNRSMADRLLYSSRFMILLLGLGIGIVIFLWAKALYGDWGGILSLAFYAFCPNFLAHSSIAHTDVGVTFFCALSGFFLWRHLESGKERDLWMNALSFGLAAAAKYNALFLVPLFLVLILLKKGVGKFLKAAGVYVLLSFLVIWASYFFEFKPLFGGGVPRVDEKLGFIAAIADFLVPQFPNVGAFLQEAAVRVSVPIPSYLLGLAGIIRSHHAPYLHYAFGEWTTQTQWYYYLFVFLVKMTIPFLCLLLLRFLFSKRSSSPSGRENLVLLTPVLALFVLTCFDSTAVGIRYLFPVIPFLLVWVGGLAKLGFSSFKWRTGLTALFLLHLASTGLAFPRHLSYFNEFVGGERGGYRYVRGSDVDWGQGLKALKRYLDRNKIDKAALEYFGSADPSFYGISYEEWTEDERRRPLNKVYVISLFYLEHARWAQEIEPTAMVAGSMFVYDLREKGKT